MLANALPPADEQHTQAACVALQLTSTLYRFLADAVSMLQADRGTIFMEIRYHPFKAAGKAATPNQPGAQKANMTLGNSKKSLTKDHKGVLTVTLIRCIDLEVRS